MTLNRELMNLLDGAAYIERPLATYHAVQAVKAAKRCRGLIDRLAGIRVALKQYRVMVTLAGDSVRIYRPDTGREFLL